MKNMNVKAYALLLVCALSPAAATVAATPAPQLAAAPASYDGTYH